MYLVNLKFSDFLKWVAKSLVADTSQAPEIAQNLPPNAETTQHIVADEVHAQKKYTREQDATRDTRVVTHRDGVAFAGAKPSMLPQRLQQRLGPRSGAISTQSGPSTLPRHLQGRLGRGSDPQDLSHNAHPSDEETLMSMLLRMTRENNQLRRNSQQESSVPRESSPQHHRSRSVSRRSQYSKERSMSVSGYSSSDQIDLERDIQRSRNLVLQRGQYRLARESAGDRKGSQQWARSHRTGALHNFVGGYAQTRELNLRRAEANFMQHRQDSVEPGWSPERRNRTHRVGTNNVALQENSDNLNEQQKHNKGAKTSVSQSQKQDGCPSKDLTLPELSINISELYDKLKGKLYKPFPMKPDTEGRRDKSKKCKYHNDFGHTLNDCYALKKEISRMADGGQLKEYLKGSQKLAHVNLIEHDVIAVDRASSESKDPVDVEDRQTLASLCKQLKRKHPTFNDSDQGMNPSNLGSFGGDHEDTGGDIIPTESEKSESEVESEEETLDDLERETDSNELAQIRTQDTSLC
ncbi:hypothetical protein IFM89_037813 [Coptis chinensis]|uniref:Uncharacterized protein n=1 Tax=Coptis chinensis TaxID=261450 RepID=A0A835HA43_9MAGN|nr:hypothetical protein IFM89_037813 [Coptis chinensis]